MRTKTAIRSYPPAGCSTTGTGTRLTAGLSLLGELHAVPAQGGQALAPGEERDVVAGLMQAGGEQAAANPGAVHEQFHDNPPSYIRLIHTFVSFKRM